MADLDVQPKKRTPAWPWILLLIIIGAVAYFLLRGRSMDSSQPESGTTTTDTVNETRVDSTTP